MWYASATFFLCAVSLCADVPDQPDLKEVLSWLPADTETIVGANGPFSWTDLVAPSAIHGDAFMERSAVSVKRFDNIAGVKVAVFEETLEADVWTTFVAFPRQDIVLVATDEDYLRTVLARMRGTSGPRALPEALTEWKYVSTRAPAWGVRHYQRSDSDLDPTSPFHRQDAANAPDQQAEGVTFQFDPRGSLLTVTYLSGGSSARKIMEGFLGLTDQPVASLPKIQAHFRQRAPAVLECALPLSVPSAYRPILGLMMMLGQAVYM